LPGRAAAGGDVSEHERGGELLRQRLYGIVLRLDQDGAGGISDERRSDAGAVELPPLLQRRAMAFLAGVRLPGPIRNPTPPKNQTRDCPGNLKHLNWLNVIERWFRDLTQNRIRHGIFRSVAELEQAIRDYIDHHNARPKSFVWIKKAADILEKVTRARQVLNQLPSA
jgi:hypothetical protein